MNNNTHHPCSIVILNREKEKQIFLIEGMIGLENDYFATCDVTINSGNGCKKCRETVYSHGLKVRLHEDLLTIKRGTADIWGNISLTGGSLTEYYT